MFAATITPSSINMLVRGKMLTIADSHPAFAEIKDLVIKIQKKEIVPVETAYDDLLALTDVKTALSLKTDGRLEIGDQVFWDGVPIGGVVVQRLLNMLREGLPTQPLERFLTRCMGMSDMSRDELFLWLEAGNMPLTEDGCFIAFKKVNGNYCSIHANPDGTHEDHRPGAKPRMPRENVDPIRSNTCSTGFHFCSYSYLSKYGHGGETRVVVLKIAPEDVISIPEDYNNAKGRACGYEVIDEVPEAEAAQFFSKDPVIYACGEYDVSEEKDYEDYEDDESPPFKDRSRVENPLTGTWTKRDDKSGKFSRKAKTKPKSKGKSIVPGMTRKQIVRKVAKIGQRAFAREHQIPRSSLQDYLRKGA